MPVTDMEPWFIVGSERSGTTLMAVLLDRHSSIAVPPETHFMAWLRNQRIPPDGAGAPPIDPEALVRSPRLRDLGTDAAALARAVREGRTATCARLWRWLLVDYAVRRGKTRVVEKTPEHLREVPRLLRWFPRAQVVCLVRDGRDVCTSLRRMPWTHDDLRLHALRWRSDQRLVRRWVRRYPDRFTVVRYEDMCRQPVTVLRPILDRMGVEFELGQLDPGSETHAVPTWEREWKQDVMGTISTAGVGAWCVETTPRERRLLHSTMARELAYWGYAEAVGSRILRRWHAFRGPSQRARTE